MFGLLGMRAFAGLFRLLAMFSACAVLFGCMCCMKSKMRNCSCIKYLLRVMGFDEFDDFELMVLVHEAIFEGNEKMDTSIRITAGSHSVTTDPSKTGVFQQPLHIVVEQGTTVVELDIVNRRGYVLASLQLDVMQHVLNAEGPQSEVVWNMTTKSKGIIKPRVRLTMVVDQGADAESGLLRFQGVNTDVDILVRQQLQKAKHDHEGGKGDDKLDEIGVLKEACSGPLELFEGLGKSKPVYVAVIGPPESRRWLLGIWKDKKAFQVNQPALQEIDLLKIQTVQGDPTRNHVFVVDAFNANRTQKSLTFRRIDRARDVWVEILQLLIIQARAHRTASKAEKQKAKGTQSMSAATFSGFSRAQRQSSRSPQPAARSPSRSTQHPYGAV